MENKGRKVSVGQGKLLTGLSAKKVLKNPKMLIRSGLSASVGRKFDASRRGKISGVGNSSTTMGSSCRDNVLERKGNNASKESAASVRSNFSSLLTLMGKIKHQLKEGHLWEISMSPFRHLILCAYYGYINEAHVANVGSDIREAMKCYNVERGGFLFGSVEKKPIVEDVRYILGVEDGEEELVVEKRLKETPFYLRQSLFVSRKRREKKRLTPTIVKEQLLEKLQGETSTDFMDVARLLTLYIMATLLLTPESSLMPWGWLEILEEYQIMRKYNWSKAILEATMKSLDCGNVQYGGCPLVILFWVCENSDIIPCINDRWWPRFRKWNISELSARIKAGEVSICEMVGYKWTGSARVCQCEWAKADYPEMDNVPEECDHSGDPYTGEHDNIEEEATFAEYPDCSLRCSQERMEDNLMIEELMQCNNSDSNVVVGNRVSYAGSFSLVDAVGVGLVDAVGLDVVGLDADGGKVGDAVAVEGVCDAPWVEGGDAVDVDRGVENGGKVGDAGMVEGVYVASGGCDAAWVEGGDALDVDMCVEDCGEVGDVGDDESSDAFDEEMTDAIDEVGYEADEGELPDTVYDEAIEIEDNLLEADEGTYNNIVGCSLMEDLNYDPDEVMEFIKGAGRSFPSAKRIMYELFDLDEEVKELNVMNKKLVAEMEVLRVDNNKMSEINNKLVAELEFLRANRKCIIEGSSNVVPKEGPKGNRKTAARDNVSALKMNSMVRRIKERARRNRKRNSEFTYHSKSKTARTGRSKSLKPIPMAMTGDAV